LDDDTDDENEIQDLNLTGDILTITNNTGATDINLGGYLDNTDDQTASEVSITDAGGNFTSTDVEGALSELATGSSDDQNISGSGLASNILTIGIENGTSEDVDLSSLDESADVAANAANIATNTTNIANNTADIATNTTDISTNTTNITTNATNIVTNTTDIATNATNIADHIALDDDTDSGNEYNTAFAVNGANLEVTDEGGTLSVPLSSINTDDQTAAEVSYDNSSSSLTSTNVQDALDEAVSNGAAAIAANTTL